MGKMDWMAAIFYVRQPVRDTQLWSAYMCDGVDKAVNLATPWTRMNIEHEQALIRRDKKKNRHCAPEESNSGPHTAEHQLLPIQHMAIGDVLEAGNDLQRTASVRRTCIRGFAAGGTVRQFGTPQ